jgi:hypothetical protein
LSPSALALGLVVAWSSAARAAAWRYDVQADAQASVLTVDARFDGGDGATFAVDDEAAPFVDDVAIDDGGRWRPVAAARTGWRVPACARGCHLRYRFRLGDAAARLRSDAAARFGPTTQSPPSTWLLRPLSPRPGRSYRFVVHVPPPAHFVSGVRRNGDGYEADVSQLDDAPWSAFGTFALERLDVDGGIVDVALVPKEGTPSVPAAVAAVAHAADVVRRYFGRFPIDRLLVLVLPSDGPPLHGRTVGGGGATLELLLGDGLSERALRESWIPVHELVHVAFPTMPRAQLWIEEGLATYLEPIMRARVGDLDAASVWRDLVEGLPQGQPEPGDRGLDRTATWGRTYWGGALYCLLADVEIRERTHNAKSLDDAVRAIVAAGGNISVDWPLDRALAIGDAAVGVPVLTTLRRRLGTRPVTIDLPSLWRRLGVRVRGRAVELDDSAPLAPIRRAITAAPVGGL